MSNPRSDLTDALADGRQSAAALAIRRGTSRLLRAHDFACFSEFTLVDGRRADIAALSNKGDIWIIEIKSSLNDFRADTKWQDYHAFCDRLFFAVDADFPLNVLPETAGIILADKYGGEILREAPEDRLAAGRRKAVTLRFARAAGFRLMSALDPEILRNNG